METRILVLRLFILDSGGWMPRLKLLQVHTALSLDRNSMKVPEIEIEIEIA